MPPRSVSPMKKPAAKAPAASAAKSPAAATGSKASITAAKPSAAAKTRKPSPSKLGPAKKAAPSTKAGSSAAAKSSSSTAKAGKKAADGAATAPSTSAAAAAAEPEPDPEEVKRQEEARAKQWEATQAEMEELRKKAWLAQVEYDKKQAAKKRKQQEEETRRKKEEAALRKALLEAAYDNEVADLEKGLQTAAAGGLIKDAADCADPHGNTLLSEAAAGGGLEAVQLLLKAGANPNSQGEFKRTPLWRAAFLGKADVVMPLLEAGADPRIGNEQGETPLHVANTPEVKAMLNEWDISRTDQLVADWARLLETKKESEAAERAAAIRSAEGDAEAAQEAYSSAQQVLKHARQELEKRIYEYDMCMEEKKPEELTKVALEQIHIQEAAVEAARKKAADAGERLDAARLALREREAAGAEDEAALPGAPVDIKDLDDVLVRDVGGKLAATGKWPLVIDTSGQASVFLRYQDSNYVNALSSSNIEPNRLRRSILGGLRYGKPVVVDLMEVGALWGELPRIFNTIQPGLFDNILNKSITTEDVYARLIRKEDGEEYDITRFQPGRIARFQFVVLTASKHPDEDMLARLHALRVVVKG